VVDGDLTACREDLRSLEEALQAEIAALREELTDLTAAANLWRRLYEGAIRRCAEREGELDEDKRRRA
jgi:hypothetical protein